MCYLQLVWRHNDNRIAELGKNRIITLCIIVLILKFHCFQKADACVTDGSCYFHWNSWINLLCNRKYVWKGLKTQDEYEARCECHRVLKRSLKFQEKCKGHVMLLLINGLCVYYWGRHRVKKRNVSIPCALYFIFFFFHHLE